MGVLGRCRRGQGCGPLCLLMIAAATLGQGVLAAEASRTAAGATTASPASASPPHERAAPIVVRDYDLGALRQSLAARSKFPRAHDVPPIAPLLQPLAESLVATPPDRITVHATQTNHRRIAELLELWHREGLPQITLEIRFIASSVDVVEQVSEQGRRLRTQSAPQDEALPAANEFQRPLMMPGQPGVELIESRLATTQHVPVMTETLDAAQTRRLVEAAQADARANLLQAPKVTTFNGQSAVIADVTQRPFVVAVDTSTAPPRPQVRVLSEGTTVRYRAVVAPSAQTIRLDCHLQFDQIVEVETHDLGFTVGEPLTVQIPHVRSQTIAVAANLPFGHSLLVGGGPLNDRAAQPKDKQGIAALLGFGSRDQQPQQLYVLLTPRVLDP